MLNQAFMDPVEIEYPYRESWKGLLFAVIFFGACTCFLFYVALTNRNGLIINGILPLSPKAASIFYWVITAIAFLFVVAGVVKMLFSIFIPQRIAFTKKTLVVPVHIWSSEEGLIPYESITKIDESKLKRMGELTVYHQAGKLKLKRHFLPSPKDLDQLLQELRLRLGKMGKD